MEVKILSYGKSLLGDDDNILSASVRASLVALTKGGFSSTDIDCIICTTFLFRPTSFSAEMIKKNLGVFVASCETKDVALSPLTLAQFIETVKKEIEDGVYKRVLLLSSDGSKMRFNWNYHESNPLTGEVVSAIILGKDEDADSFLSFKKEKMEACN